MAAGASGSTGGSGSSGNGGGSGAVGKPPAPKPPGSLVLSGPIRIVQLNVVPLSFQCGDLACYLDAQLFSRPFGATDAGAAKLVLAGRWKGKVPAHARRTLRVRLGKAAARALARRGRLKVTIVINIRAGARRQKITRSATIVLKRH